VNSCEDDGDSSPRTSIGDEERTQVGGQRAATGANSGGIRSEMRRTSIGDDGTSIGDEERAQVGGQERRLEARARRLEAGNWSGDSYHWTSIGDDRRERRLEA